MLKTSDRFFFFGFLIVFLLSVSGVLLSMNNKALTEIPTEGGVFIEGVVGTPRFINPVLAITRADKDIAELVYSGLATISPEGEITPDLAESITLSEDGTVYNIVLKQGMMFHDGTPVTAEDVAFTIALIQNSELKSPLRGNWIDVTTEVLSENEINLVLKEPYAPFIENLTIGILPKHVWSPLTIEQFPFSQNNTEPIGSGPYMVSSVLRNASGLIESYTLTPSPYNGYEQKISEIKFKFYQSEELLVDAVNRGEVLATASLTHPTIAGITNPAYIVIDMSLPRSFAVYFNQNKSEALRSLAVRRALQEVLDREDLLARALDNHGIPMTTPIPSTFFDIESLSPVATSTPSTLVSSTTETSLVRAENMLIDDGWERDENGVWAKEVDDTVTTLDVSLKTSNNPISESVATYLVERWKELGVSVEKTLYEQADLVQNVIRPRDYEALLFGVDIGRALDLYPFWHSSQREDPGLNIALYTNITTDKNLEIARTTQDESERTEVLLSFMDELTQEIPAIFLFSPSLTYVVHEGITISSIERLSHPSERFDDISNWYMHVDRVWPIFNEGD